MATAAAPATAASPMVVSLLKAGASAGLTSLSAALSLDLDASVPGESARAAEHLAALRAEFVAAETRQRMLQALVKGKDEQDGAGASLLGVLSSLQATGASGAQGEALASRQHEAAMRTLQERQTQAQAELAEIQSHTTAQATAIKADIQKLLQGWSAVETSKTALEEARQQPAAHAALTQWAALRAAWASVEGALTAADALAPLHNAVASAQGREATTTLAEALKEAQIRIDALSSAAENTPPAPGAAQLEIQQLSETSALLQKQLQALAEWSSRNDDLAATVAIAQKAAPRITSFAAAQAEAAAALQHDASLTPELSAALKASRVANSVLSKLSGITVLRREIEDFCGPTGTDAPLSATRLTVCVRGQAGIAQDSDVDMYASEEAFARVLAAQEAAQQSKAEPDCIVLSLLVYTPAQASEAAACQGHVAVAAVAAAAKPGVAANSAEEMEGAVLLAGHAMGALPAAALAELQQQAQQGRIDIAAALERNVLPCAAGVNGAVARSVERALELQMQYKVRGVEALLRDIAFDVQQL